MRRIACAARAGADDLASPPEQLSVAWLAVQLRSLIGALRGRRLCLAYSGGLDSSVLLCALASLRRRERFHLRALHVNHQLQSEAGAFARAAQAQARRLRVPFELLTVTVARAAGESPEAAARAARYQALARALKAGELLLTAHHQQDQLETVFLALLRGSGVRGLSAMSALSPFAGTLLLRPLLPMSRAALERYALEQALAACDDPSNLDPHFARNYLRSQVLPLIYRRWPAAGSTVARSATLLREARVLLESQACAALAPARDGTALRVSVLRRLPLMQRRAALRQWIGERGLASPDHRRLREIAGPMLESRRDALPTVRWQGGQLRRHGDRLFALEQAPPRPTPLAWDWRAQPWLALGDGSELGLTRERHGEVLLSALPASLAVRFRHGGERLHAGRSRIALKDLMQKEGIAPWERAGVPLIADGERIIAVADLWLDPAYVASAAHAAGRAPRGRFRWRQVSP